MGEGYSGPKYIFVFGGVCSGIGKGVITASMGRILREYGLNTTAIKIDPYYNTDAGTMRPTEHGEVWVTYDGREIDQDLGNYERFLGVNIPGSHSITTGIVNKILHNKERMGEYGGKSVQPVPHVVETIIDLIAEASAGHDLSLIEVGGTVGDYENAMFLEAAATLECRLGGKNVMHCLVSLLPIVNGEQKTKPTQQALRNLHAATIRPDLIFCRANDIIDSERREKIKNASRMRDPSNIISAPDVKNIYQIPLNLEREGLGQKILNHFGLEAQKQPAWDEWRALVARMKQPRNEVRIALVGKYIKSGDYDLRDSYLSVEEALRHSGASLDARVITEMLDAKEFEEGGDLETKLLEKYHGVLVPGGFGTKGVEGKINAIRYARENSIPFLGLCYGLQLACVEYARNMCGLANANTAEVDKNTPHPVVYLQPEQKNVTQRGGTQRCGAYVANLKTGKILKLYEQQGRLACDAERIDTLLTGANEFRRGKCGKKNAVMETHRHRYEVNPDYADALSKQGLIFSGFHTRTDGTKLAEFIELAEKDHPYFVATQAHPEFASRLGKPAPLFMGFVEAALKRASR